MKIYLVRHGQDEDNAKNIINGQRDTHLTELGRQQAASAGLELQGKDIKIIFASSLKRAQQTAQIINQVLGVKQIITIEDLKERDLGKLSGLSKKAAEQKAAKLFPTLTYTYISEGEGVETFPELFNRAQKALKEILSQEPEGNILIVAHNDMVMMLKAVITHQTWQEVFLSTPHLNNGEIVVL